MKTIRTAKGKMLDMGALAAQNEETRAISNVPINASCLLYTSPSPRD